MSENINSTVSENPISNIDIKSISSKYEDGSAKNVIKWAIDQFGSSLVLATSFQAEGMVIIDIAHKINPDIQILTIDTGRLPQETYDLIDKTRVHYSVPIKIIHPDPTELANMVYKHGINAFYQSVSLRLMCCQIRKVDTMNSALKDYSAWISGLRRSQEATRSKTEKIEIDKSHGNMIKINPLVDWTTEETWKYIKSNNIPYNTLYDKNYTSIGCAPCTRPTKHDEDPRAGRWWWEKGMPKECGIHLGPAWGRTN